MLSVAVGFFAVCQASKLKGILNEIEKQAQGVGTAIGVIKNDGCTLDMLIKWDDELDNAGDQYRKENKTEMATRFSNATAAVATAHEKCRPCLSTCVENLLGGKTEEGSATKKCYYACVEQDFLHSHCMPTEVVEFDAESKKLQVNMTRDNPVGFWRDLISVVESESSSLAKQISGECRGCVGGCLEAIYVTDPTFNTTWFEWLAADDAGDAATYALKEKKLDTLYGLMNQCLGCCAGVGTLPMCIKNWGSQVEELSAEEIGLSVKKTPVGLIVGVTVGLIALVLVGCFLYCCLCGIAMSAVWNVICCCCPLSVK